MPASQNWALCDRPPFAKIARDVATNGHCLETRAALTSAAMTAV